MYAQRRLRQSRKIPHVNVVPGVVGINDWSITAFCHTERNIGDHKRLMNVKYIQWISSPTRPTVEAHVDLEGEIAHRNPSGAKYTRLRIAIGATERENKRLLALRQ